MDIFCSRGAITCKKCGNKLKSIYMFNINIYDAIYVHFTDQVWSVNFLKYVNLHYQ